MAKWVIDLKRSQTEISEENFPKPPGYSDDLETVSNLILLKLHEQHGLTALIQFELFGTHDDNFLTGYGDQFERCYRRGSNSCKAKTNHGIGVVAWKITVDYCFYALHVWNVNTTF